MSTHSLLICLLTRPLIHVPICFYNNEDVIESINKSEFKNLLSLDTQELYFIFNDAFYKQKGEVAMGSSLGSTMANVFLSFYEVKWLEQCPKEFKLVF